MKRKSVFFKIINSGGKEGGNEDRYREWIQQLWWQKNVRDWYNLRMISSRVFFFNVSHREGMLTWIFYWGRKESSEEAAGHN